MHADPFSIGSIANGLQAYALDTTDLSLLRQPLVHNKIVSILDIVHEIVYDIRIRSGSGRRSAVEAIRNIYSPIAWLPPGYKPGAGDGVASAGRQMGRLGLGTFWFDNATSGSLRRIAIAA